MKKPPRSHHQADHRAGWLLGAVLGLLVLVPASRGEPGFIASLDQARLTELRLDRLTETERAALDTAIQAYLKEASSQAKRKEAINSLGKIRAAPDPDLQVQSRIAGPFTGWSGNALFRLANGQTWQQVGADRYYHPFPEGVEVTIVPVGLGAFRLRLPTGASVMVRRRQ